MLALGLIGLTLSGCSLLRTHKEPIQQGNIITQANVSRLHQGMSEAQVKSIMGTPLLVNIFTPGRLDYIYTIQNPYQAREQTQVSCWFERGRLVRIIRRD